MGHDSAPRGTTSWGEALDNLAFAYQPIFDSETGRVFGYEALLRGVGKAGFRSIWNVFDRAFRERKLILLDLKLVEKAFALISAAGLLDTGKIFYNLDNRLLAADDYLIGDTLRVADELGIPRGNIVLELSERFDLSAAESASGRIEAYRNLGVRIAIDDYGTGYAGLRLLYDSAPDYVKIDRYFVGGIADSERKRFFVESIVAMAHELGAEVVAEGVEDARECEACRRCGCDYLQGFALGVPETDMAALGLDREGRDAARAYGA
jgi:EAL domain-containing protein (putative c-di-GMP-specific phosphodiesterase class I)